MVAWLIAVGLSVTSTADASQLSRGKAALSDGDYESAERELRAAVEADPHSASALFNLGIALSRQGEYRESVAAIERALAIDPNLPGAHLMLGIGLYHLERYSTARDELELAAREAPGDASVDLFLGLDLQALGFHDEAVRRFERCAQADPELAQVALYNSGVSHWKAGRSDEATDALRRAVERDPMSEAAADAVELSDSIARSDEGSRRWSLSGTAGTEYDSNVVESLVDITSGELDVVGIFELSGAYQVVRTEKTEVEVGYDFYQTLHLEQTEFNVQSHGASLGASREFGWLDVGASYRFAYATMDWDELFMMHGARPSLAVSPFPWWYVETSYQFWHKDFSDSARDAIYQDVGIDQYFFFQEQQAYFRVGYRAAIEDADGAEFDFFGQFAEAGFHLPVPFLRATDLDLGYGYLIKDYSHITPSIGEKRHDRRHRADVGLTRRFRDFIIARIEYQFTLAESNLPSADYTQHIAGVRLGFDF